MEGVSLIDVSSEDDLLIAASTDGSPNPPTSGNSVKYEQNWVGSETVVNVCEEMPKKMEQVPGLSESPERKQAKHVNYNMRKSLAWDKAFFTSEGVLNTEELGMVNSTFRKAQQAQTLPGIQEDVRRSSDSTSTLDGGDRWGLETLEVDLFENLRASIQKSVGKSDKAPTLVHSKAGLSQNKLKPPTMIRRHDMKQQRDDASKEPLVRVKVAASGNRDSKGSLKPPKIIASGVASKKSSGSCNVQIRSSQGNEVNSVEPRERQAVKKNLTPWNQGSSSDASRKRSGRSIDHPSSGSAPKTPVRPSKATIGSRNTHHPPSRLNPPSKFSSSLSPSSSIDSFVSGSSSSSNSIPLNSTEADSSAASPPLLPALRIPRPLDSRKLSTDRSKPSGLRMPTPKIGYFDAEKSLVRSSNTTTASKTSGVNKSQLGKLQPPRPAALDSTFARSALPKLPGTPRAAKNPGVGRVKVFERESGAADVAKDESSPMLSGDPNRRMGESEPHVLWLSYIKEGFTESKEKENSLPEDKNIPKMELLERRVSSLSLSETKDLNGVAQQQRPRYTPSKENENSFPEDKMELLERRVSSLSLSETKNLESANQMVDAIAQQQRPRVLQSSPKLAILAATVDAGPNARVPLVDKFLQ